MKENTNSINDYVILLKRSIFNNEELYKFTSASQIFGTATNINSSEFLNKSAGYAGTQFHFDSGENERYISFDMSSKPECISKMKMWSSSVSNNTYDIEYSKDKTTWTKSCSYTHSSGWGECKIECRNIFPYWRIIVKNHWKQTPWYCIEWYYYT